MNYKKISFLIVIVAAVVLLGGVTINNFKYNLPSFLTASLLTQPIQTQPGGNFAVLANSTITNTGTTSITGDLGLYPGTSVTGDPTVNGTQYINVAAASNAQTALTEAYNEAASQSQHPYTHNYSGTNLGTLTLTPGVYYFSSSAQLTGTLTLNGGGDANAVFIFQIGSTLTTAAGAPGTPGSKVTLINSAQACNVFWQVGSSATIGTYSEFVGNIMALESITLNTGATVNGRVLASTGAVTLDTNTITLAECRIDGTCGTNGTVAGVSYATGIATWPIGGTFCTLGDGVATPASPVFPTAGNSVTWTCGGSNLGDSSGTCTATRATTPSSGGGGSLHVPIIDIVKVPSPLALPNGPGPVTYTYTLKNIGIVPMTDITVVDDICSPMVFVSGDTNNDLKLDVSETWTYNCFKTLSATSTNIVVATGWNSGFSATDIATATVVVGVPIVPPLIHVTKVPSPLVLPAGGGIVTYTKKVTNPGTVALSNVQIIDDKCDVVKYISGDTNGDSKLDVSETWTYTCNANLTKTTTNTVTVTGQANGLTARDFAIVTVVVAVPTPVPAPASAPAPAPAPAPALPNTGVSL